MGIHGPSRGIELGGQPDIGITTRRPKAAQYEFAKPTPIWLDGRRIAAAQTLSIRVEPDAVDVWI